MQVTCMKIGRWQLQEQRGNGYTKNKNEHDGLCKQWYTNENSWKAASRRPTVRQSMVARLVQNTESELYNK